MKYTLLICFPILFGIQLCTAQHPVAKNEKYNLATGTKEDILPTEQQVKTDIAVNMLLARYHYRKISLNDSLSEVVFDRYLQALDPNHMYFLQSDIRNFEKYRTQLDDAIKEGDLVPAYYIYNVYKRRFLERNAFVPSLLEKEFDYQQDEYYQADRQKAPWAKDTKELDDLWRRFVKNQALSLKLSGKSWTDITKLLKERFSRQAKNMAQFDSEDVFQIYLNAYTQTFDPHTDYFSPSTAEDFKIDMYQALEGIGATLTNENDYVKIADIVPGGPAFKSSLVHKNDRIIGVAQGDTGKITDIVGWRVVDAVKLIRGKKGTIVRLLILPASAGEEAMSTEIRLVRDKVKLEEGRAKKNVLNIQQENKTYKIGVITIPQFYFDYEGARRGEADYASVTRDTKRLIGELQAEKVEGLIIDLRNNGGGSLQEAVSLTGLFISKGPVVQVKSANGDVDTYDDTDADVAYTGPLAVLVNRFSASASEIFAGAIQDYKRGLIIGENTYGKGTVQQPIDLGQIMPDVKEPVGQVKVTIAKFYRITGSSTQHKGVRPDIEFPSVYDAQEFGESSQPSALPWDQIRTTHYNLANYLNENASSNLKSRYQQRLVSNPELKNLAESIQEDIKDRKDTRVTLQESKRRKEMKEEEEKQKTRENLYGISNDPASKPKDVYLNEGARVLVDYIARHYIASRK
jgi:carboxyl-terminal processing protease